MPLPKKKTTNPLAKSEKIESTYDDTREVNHHGTSIRSLTINAPKYEHNTQGNEVIPPSKPKKRGRPKGSKNKAKAEEQVSELTPELSAKPVEPIQVSKDAIHDAIQKDLVRRGLKNPTYNDY